MSTPRTRNTKMLTCKQLGARPDGQPPQLEWARRLADRLDVGMVGINQPRVSFVEASFGGMKESGFGRSGSIRGLDEYLKPRPRPSGSPGSHHSTKLEVLDEHSGVFGRA